MLRYAHDTELDRIRRSNRRAQIACAFLLPVEIAGFAYLLNYLFAV